jgi:hypothetical protein
MDEMHLPRFDGVGVNKGGETPCPKLGRAQACGIGHEKQRGFFLPALEVERNSFFKLTVAEMIHWRL